MKEKGKLLKVPMHIFTSDTMIRTGSISGSRFDKERGNSKKNETSRNDRVTIIDKSEYHRLLFEKNVAGIYFSTIDGQMLDCNESFARMLGYSSPEEVLSHRAQDLYHDGSDREAFLAQLREHKNLTNLELCLRKKDGSPVWILENVSLIEGDTLLIHGTAIDIMERKEAEKELRESEELYRTLVRTSPEAVTVTDLEGHITYVSEETLRLYNIERAEDAIGRSAFDFIAPEDREKALKSLQKTYEVGYDKNIDYTMLRRDGSQFIGELNASLIRDANGNPKAFIATVRDITERRRMEEILRESEEKYRSFVKNLQGIAFRGRMDWIPLFFHGAVEEITGYTEEEFISGTPRWDEIIYPEDLQRVEESAEKLRAVPHYSANREYRIIRKDGEVRWVQEFIQNVCDAGRPTLVQGTIYDITERKKIEAELRESEEKYRNLFEAAPDAIITVDLSGMVTSCNAFLTEETGYSQDEIIEKHFTELKFLSKGDIPKYLEMYASILRGDVPQLFETTWLHKDGIQRVAEIHISVLKKGGDVTGFQAIARDITERKKMEEAVRRAHDTLLDLTENLEKKVAERTEEVVRANQLKSEFLANMSHEFRTPLNSILSFAEILLMGLDGSLNDQQREDLEMIRESGTELLTLVNNILDLSKIEAGRLEICKERINAGEVIAAVSSQLTVRALEKGLNLTTEVPEGLPAVSADEARLKQVLRNLLENALKFTEKGDVKIGVYCNKDEMIFCVKDTGIGISKEDQEIIFDKFRQAQGGTTKEFRGTGLGLSVAKELVELHGGKIWVESEPGKGSTFFFSIPLT